MRIDTQNKIYMHISNGIVMAILLSIDKYQSDNSHLAKTLERTPQNHIHINHIGAIGKTKAK